MPDSAQLTPVIEVFSRLLKPLQRYHRHAAYGLEHVPREGGALIVTNHSLATYDGFLLGLAIYEGTGRVPTGLGDDRLFSLPWLAELAYQANLRPASPENGERLLRQGHLVFLAPGGMREAIRPSARRYRVLWDDRRGFARLALRSGVPVLLAACPAADDIYTVLETRWTHELYQRFKLPLPLAFGHKGTPLPRPVQLTHYLSAPIAPPPHEVEREQEQVDAFHATLVARMQQLLDEHAPDAPDPSP